MDNNKRTIDMTNSSPNHEKSPGSKRPRLEKQGSVLTTENDQPTSVTMGQPPVESATEKQESTSVTMGQPPVGSSTGLAASMWQPPGNLPNHTDIEQRLRFISDIDDVPTLHALCRQFALDLHSAVGFLEADDIQLQGAKIDCEELKRKVEQLLKQKQAWEKGE